MKSDSKANPSDETQSHSKESKSEPGGGGGGQHADYAPYPKLEPDDVAPVANTWSTTAAAGGSNSASPATTTTTTTMPTDSNPYVSAAHPVPATSTKNNMDKVWDALGIWGTRAAEATKKAEDNMWQLLKTIPSLADAAFGRIAQSTKVLAEGGYEKVFQNTFENGPEEKLLMSYGCCLSTSAGPVVGVLYLSTSKVAFCSDDPLSYKVGEEAHWSYYKVVIPLHQLKAVNTSASKINPAEKYIQIISVDNHEFLFIGFGNYGSAVKNLQCALQVKTIPSLADAAFGRIAQSTKVLAEGGYEKVFQNTFENGPEEKLLMSYGCCLSTSAGPVVGVLYLSTSKVAFCSDDPLSYKVGEEAHWSYYKVVIPLHQLKAVNTSASKINPAEKYIQIISVDNHEFLFIGFGNYGSAVKNLQCALQGHPL